MTKTFMSKIPAVPKEPSPIQIGIKAQKLATQHILDAIDPIGFEDCPYFNPCRTEKEKAEFLYKRFHSEYAWNIQRIGQQRALVEWLQGLAINIAYWNHDILRLAREWGSLPDDATEKQENNIVENYWPYMAMRILSLWRQHKCH